MVRESPRPPVKLPGRYSPAPIRKLPPNSNEETKEIIADPNKYRRHKNLPNITYSKRSNIILIRNSITQTLLAGEPNRLLRDEILQKIQEFSSSDFLVILFKSDLGHKDI